MIEIDERMEIQKMLGIDERMEINKKDQRLMKEIRGKTKSNRQTDKRD